MRVKNEPVAVMAPQMKRPELGRGVVLASIFGFWLFYVVIVTLRASVLGFEQQGELAWRRVIVTILGIGLTIILWQVLRLFDYRRLNIRIIAATLAALPAAFAVACINFYVFNIYDASSMFTDTELQEVSTRSHMVKEIAELTISRYFIMIAWSALYLALGFSNDVRESERRAGLFAKAAQEAELRALRYQVNPHFLFNTLNSLSALVMKNRNIEAEAMIMNLSHFFRASLTADPSSDVALSDEVRLQKLYLDIESVRFPKRLKAQIDVPKSLEDAPIPGLILQPLVENAIKHGVARTSATVTITVSARAAGDKMILTVADDAKTEGIAENGSGIGITNVRERLAARFGNDAHLKVDRPEKGGFIVTLTIPLAQND